MKTSQRLPFFLVLLATFGLLLPATAFAQRGEGPRSGERYSQSDERPYAQGRQGPGMRGGGGLAMRGEGINPRHLLRHAEELELSDGQQSRIRAILESQRDEVRPIHEGLREESQALQELMSTPAAQRSAIMAQLEVVLDLENELKRQRASLMLDIRDVLSPAQRAKAQEIMEARRGSDRRQNRQLRPERRR